MITVHHMATTTTLDFMDDVDPRWAVAFSHCAENNTLSWLFDCLHDGKLEEAYKKLPMTYGKVSIACGDWGTMTYGRKCEINNAGV